MHVRVRFVCVLGMSAPRITLRVLPVLGVISIACSCDALCGDVAAAPEGAHMRVHPSHRIFVCPCVGLCIGMRVRSMACV